MALITAAPQTQVTTSIINHPQPVPVITLGLLVPCLHLHLVPAGLSFILMVAAQRMVDLVPELVLECTGDLEIQSRFGQIFAVMQKFVKFISLKTSLHTWKKLLKIIFCYIMFFSFRNISDRLEGEQTNQRAEIMVSSLEISVTCSSILTFRSLSRHRGNTEILKFYNNNFF